MLYGQLLLLLLGSWTCSNSRDLSLVSILCWQAARTGAMFAVTCVVTPVKICSCLTTK